MVCLDCQHFFCRDCYTEFLKESLSSGMLCVFTECPMADCTSIVPEEFYEKLLTPPLFKKYKKFLLRSFVELNKSLKWCPAPGCEHAVSYPKMKTRNIECVCGESWCFKCGEEAHRPLNCETLKKWKNKDTDNSEDSWIVVNTKPCPFCGANIQKNEGCMHMTCRCRREFCWLCLGDWAEHGSETGGYYDCNKFNERRLRGEYT